MIRLLASALLLLVTIAALAQPLVVGGQRGQFGETVPGNIVVVGPQPGQALDSGVAKTTVPVTGNAGISAPPASLGNWANVNTACSGDLSHVVLTSCYQTTGVLTLGQPTSGYVYTPEAYPFSTYYYNSSGFNNSTSGNTGRTAAVADFVRVEQAGQGDAVGHTVVCGLDAQTRAGATSFLANPACVLFNGNALAGANGQYLNLTEFDAADGGFDVAAIGSVVNLNRTNGTGALGATWLGFRVQSTGSTPVDTAFSASGTGGYKFGLDVSNATLDANLAAITLTGNQRIYGNVTPGNFFPSAVGTTYFGYSVSNTGWLFVANGQPTILMTSSNAFLYGPTVQLGTQRANQVSVAGATTTNAPTIVSVGSDTNIDLSLSGKGTGTLVVPNVATGTPVASLCLDASNHIIKKTTAGSCI